MLRIATRKSWVKSAIVGVRRRHDIAATFQSSLPVRDCNHTIWMSFSGDRAE